MRIIARVAGLAAALTVVLTAAPALAGRPWRERVKLAATDARPDAYLGGAVDIEGSLAITGAHNDLGLGAAYVFARDPAGWHQEAKLVPADLTPGTGYGRSVGVSGDRAVVGAPWGPEGGAVYVFRRVSPGFWTQEAKLTLAGSGPALFGRSVAIHDDRIVVGMPQYGGSGGIRIYRLETSWVVEETIWALGSQNFGSAVAYDGQRAIIGAELEEVGGVPAGSASIMRRDGTEWSTDGYITAGAGAAFDYFGCSVAIDGERAIVGAQLADAGLVRDAGAAYAFRYVSPGVWVQENKMTSGGGGDVFGNSVSISGDRAVVGGYLANERGTDSGVAYVFRYWNAGWRQETSIMGNDTQIWDSFGSAVCVDAKTIFVGAFHHDVVPRDTGAVHVFLCLADLTGDGVVDIEDYFAYVDYFDLGDPLADIDGDTDVDMDDFWLFLGHYDGQC